MDNSRERKEKKREKVHVRGKHRGPGEKCC